jgi:hypothetical protein
MILNQGRSQLLRRDSSRPLPQPEAPPYHDRKQSRQDKGDARPEQKIESTAGLCRLSTLLGNSVQHLFA